MSRLEGESELKEGIGNNKDQFKIQIGKELVSLLNGEKGESLEKKEIDNLTILFLNYVFLEAIEEAKRNKYWAVCVIPALLKIWEIEEERINEVFDEAIEKAKEDAYWAVYVIPALLKTWEIEEERINEVFDEAIEKAKEDAYWAVYVIPALLKTWEIEEERINEVFDEAIEKAKEDAYWAVYVIPALLETWEIEEEKIFYFVRREFLNTDLINLINRGIISIKKSTYHTFLEKYRLNIEILDRIMEYCKQIDDKEKVINSINFLIDNFLKKGYWERLKIFWRMREDMR